MKQFVEQLETRRLLSTYYVATSGNDNNAGTQGAPFATMQEAGNKVKAGDTVMVEPGTYAGFCLSWNNAQAGTAGAPITFEADPSQSAGGVTINSRNNETAVAIDLEPGSNYVDINGFVIENNGTVTKEGIKATGNNDQITNDTVTGVGGFGIFTDNANNALVANDNISGTTGTNTTGHGIYISGTCSGVIVENNIIDGNGWHGIHLNGDISEGGVGEVIDATIANNLIYNNPGNGINGDGLVDSVIENNCIYGYTNNGISLYTIDAGVGSSGNVIMNNTIVGHSAVELQDNATNNVIFNNILLGTVSTDDTSSDVMSNNITSGNSSTLFVNASGGNYQLASGSAAIGAGVASFDGDSAPATDMLDDSRVSGRYDAGAYEYGGTSGGSNVPGVVASNGGQYTVSGTTGAETMDVTSGTVTLMNDISATLGNYTLEISSGANVALDSDQTVGALQLAGTGTLDMTTHEMVINYGSNADPVSTIGADVKNGFNGGAWTGHGITSSTAAADAANPTDQYGGNAAIGYADNLSLGRTDLPTNSVLIRFTYYGDADLNGQVNLDDFSDWEAGFQSPKQNPDSWVNGDFLYSGSVNLDDFSAWLSSFQAHLGSLAPLSLSAQSPVELALQQQTAAAQSVFSDTPLPTADASLLND